MKSKVTQATFRTEYASPNGMIYYHDIEFEDGSRGSYGSKSKDQTKFVVGQETEYEKEETKYGFKIKPVSPAFNRETFNNNGNKKPFDPEADKFRQAIILAQSTMTKVVDMAIHSIIKIEDIQKSCDKLMQYQLDLAHKYKDYTPI